MMKAPLPKAPTMPHAPGTLRCWPLLLLTPALVAQAQAPAAYASRLEGIESVMARFYRGEAPEAATRRVNALVEAYNAQVRQTNQEADAARAQAEQALAPARATAALLEARDKALGAPPDPSDRDAVRGYNARVDARNALAAQYNERQARARAAVEACNARIRGLDEALDRTRRQVESEQGALKARNAAFAAFRAQDRDVAFFTSVNRLLADLREADRSRPDPGLAQALAQVRACRRDLATWAAARQAAQDNGLVLVLATALDEPCCFIVDTGAQQVCLPEEIIQAIGLAGSLGEPSTMILAGGQKVSGRAITLPRLATSGMAARDVPGSAIPPSEVGIDGLLGQTFLKRFTYTIDERRPEKLLLTPR